MKRWAGPYEPGTGDRDLIPWPPEQLELGLGRASCGGDPRRPMREVEVDKDALEARHQEPDRGIVDHLHQHEAARPARYTCPWAISCWGGFFRALSHFRVSPPFRGSPTLLRGQPPHRSSSRHGRAASMMPIPAPDPGGLRLASPCQCNDRGGRYVACPFEGSWPSGNLASPTLCMGDNLCRRGFMALRSAVRQDEDKIGSGRKIP